MSCLVVISGRAKGQTYQVSPERDNVVGRMGDCQVCLADQRASRRHCVISAGQTGYTVRDLGSANGIYVNGKRVRDAALKDCDRLRVGTTEMEFHVTERFEDAETKRLAPGQALPPDLGLPAGRKPAKADTEALQFCDRCAGSIPTAHLSSGRARSVDGQMLCVECLARKSAAAEAAAVAGGADAPLRLADEDDRPGRPDGPAAPPKGGAARPLPATVPFEAVKPPAPAGSGTDDMVDLDDDGLPDLPDDGGGGPADPDGATPRPGPPRQAR